MRPWGLILLSLTLSGCHDTDKTTVVQQTTPTFRCIPFNHMAGIPITIEESALTAEFVNLNGICFVGGQCFYGCPHPMPSPTPSPIPSPTPCHGEECERD